MDFFSSWAFLILMGVVLLILLVVLLAMGIFVVVALTRRRDGPDQRR
jgi:hypothetical protein